MDKVDEKKIDEQITEYLKYGKFQELKALLGLPKEFKIIVDENGKIPLELLQEILIARDKKVLNLKNCRISKVNGKELNLSEEMMFYNGVVEEAQEVTVVQGIDKDGRESTLYYYRHLTGLVERQQRIFNQHGDVESLYRHTLFDDGRLVYVDNAVISYQYKNEKKKVALYQDDLIGMVYYEYDENGDIALDIQDGAVTQHLKKDGASYKVSDGYLESGENGYTHKTIEDVEKLSLSDMKRHISGDISEDDKKSLMDSMDETRKKEVLSTLKLIVPVFQVLSEDVQKNEGDVRKKMDKMSKWFTGFLKRLKIDPELAVQNDAVMSAMRSAISKTVGRTNAAQVGITKPKRDEKEYEGEKNGDN